MTGATCITVLRNGRAFDLAICELAPGLLHIVDATTCSAWGGGLTRDERVEAAAAVEEAKRREANARASAELHDDVRDAVPAVATRAWAGC